jgi:hypothetical protein
VHATAEVLVFNADGLGLGSFGQPAQVHYSGFFIDNAEGLRLYRGSDGETYALVADAVSGRHHWYRLEGKDRITVSKNPVVLQPPTAQTLAALPAAAPPVLHAPPSPKVRIPRLAEELPIDGELEKWRRLGLVPQVIATPDSGAKGIDGPADCSATVRFAYHESDLYVQILLFDDVVSFHQPNSKHYLQDGVEICIN